MIKELSMSEWNKLPAKEIVEKTASSLRENGFEVFVVSDAKEAKETALRLIPEKSEVFVMTSVTVDSIGLGEAIYAEPSDQDQNGEINKVVLHAAKSFAWNER
jgi:L-lactate utilization protein LutB